jgi:hypothetical protein
MTLKMNLVSTVGRRALLVAAAVSIPVAVALAQEISSTGSEKIAVVQKYFFAPPDDARPMMRWWWFGPAVTKPELEREILAMKAGGIGGFEIQPVYPMALDDKANGFRNLPYLSDDFIDAVKFASNVAHANGMRVDMTLASGWPYGGAHVPIDEASARLKVVEKDLAAGNDSLAMPTLENGEKLIAVFAGDGEAKRYDIAALKQISFHAEEKRLDIAASLKLRVVIFYIASRTGQQVKRAAVDANGFVLDHFSKAAVDDHLKTVGDRLMQAFGDTPPYAVFSDSLEVYGADWTDDLPAEFKKRRGYDLIPLLPELTSGTGEVSEEVRHDWGLTLTELVDERYLTTVDDWAKAHGTRFRSQTYGHPAVSLSSNSLVALPEGEGPQWDRFSYTRWATSASHLYGRPITSAETWTWLHSPAFRATPLDMKAEADRFFLEGVNQLIGHGWPYTPPEVAEPGWSFYAAAVFNDHNPWWSVMPDVMKYLQRVSYLLRQGKAANDVAIFLPNDDAYSQFAPGEVSLSDNMPKYITPALTQQVLAAGHNFDYIDAEAIRKIGISYSVLILPHVERISPETLKLIDAYVLRGGKVIVDGSVPGHTPGFEHATEINATIKTLTQKMMKQDGVQVVSDDEGVGAALASIVKPDIQLSPIATDIGFIHRQLDDADIYFMANTSNKTVTTSATFRSTRKFVSRWNTVTGEPIAIDVGDIALHLAPYESVIVVFSDSEIGKHEAASGAHESVLADLTANWIIRFPAIGSTPALEEKMNAAQSWADNSRTEFFSGRATYKKTISLTSADLEKAKTLKLDFGEGTPVIADPAVKSGMRALLEGPIREAAVVTINGQRVGSLWNAPYVLDVTRYLHAGNNQIEIEVANTAVNLLAGREPLDFRLLNARYGERFTPMGMDTMKPLPSGLLGTVRLMETR